MIYVVYFILFFTEDDFGSRTKNKEKVDPNNKHENIEKKNMTMKVIKPNENATRPSIVNSTTNGETATDSYSHRDGNQRKRQKTLLTEKIAEEKKMEIEKEIKEAKKKRPKNLLFTTGYSSEESVSSSDEENENK